MNQYSTARTVWSKAGVSGAALGLVSGAFLFLGHAANSIGAPAAAISVSFVLWLVKFIGCILLMRYFIKKFCAGYPAATNRDSFRFGMATAALSALIYSAIYLADILFVSADLFETQMAEAISTYSPMLDSNSLAMLEKMEGSYPQISFFSNLIYCFLFGTVLSAILSRDIPSRDPFSNTEK